MAWPVVVLVFALVQSLWAWARSAASLFWSFERVDWSAVSVLWSAVTVALWPPVVLRVGAVVVVVDDGVGVWVLPADGVVVVVVELDSLSSSSTSLASSAATRGLRRRDGLGQGGGIERAQGLPGRHHLSRRDGDGGHLALDLEGGRGVG